MSKPDRYDTTDPTDALLAAAVRSRHPGERHVAISSWSRDGDPPWWFAWIPPRDPALSRQWHMVACAPTRRELLGKIRKGEQVGSPSSPLSIVG